MFKGYSQNPQIGRDNGLQPLVQVTLGKGVYRVKNKGGIGSTTIFNKENLLPTLSLTAASHGPRAMIMKL
jgi:hypothetical protein